MPNDKIDENVKPDVKVETKFDPRKQKKEDGPEVSFKSFESPLSEFNEDTWEFNKAYELLNKSMMVFHGNVKGNHEAIKDISGLYSNKDRGIPLIDRLSKPFLTAFGLGNRPSVAEMMELANNIHIIESDGRVVTYAEKYFDNSTIDVLLSNEENTIKGFGSLMAVHMGLFLSMKSMDDMPCFKTAFAGNKITPGASSGEEPPRVYITIPKKTPIAVVGSNFTAFEKDLTDAQRTINDIDRELLKADQKILKWNKEVIDCQASIERHTKEYNDKLKELEDDKAAKETAYNTWKQERHTMSDNAIREEYKQAARKAEEDKYKIWEKRFDETFAEDSLEKQNQIDEFKTQIKEKEMQEPKVPEPPKETNIFRKFWVAIGGSHSKEYRDKELIRNNRLNDHQEWEQEYKLLKNDTDYLEKQLEDFVKQRSAEKKSRYDRIEEEVNKVPSGAELKVKEEADRKKALDDADKALNEHKTKAKAELDSSVKTLSQYAKKYQDKVDFTRLKNSDKEARVKNVYNAINDMDKAKEAFNNLKTNYYQVSAEIVKQIIEPAKEEKKVLDGEYVTKILNDADVREKITTDSKLGTLGKDAAFKMMDLIQSKTMSNKPEEVEYAIAHSIIGALNPAKAEELSKQVLRHANVGFSTNSKPYAYRIGSEEYKLMQKHAAEKFEEVFGFECTPANVEKVANAIDLEKAVSIRIEDVEMQKDNIKMPLISEKNYKDINLLMMCGIKTAMGMDPLKTEEKKNNKEYDDMNKALVVRKPQPSKNQGMGM